VSEVIVRRAEDSASRGGRLLTTRAVADYLGCSPETVLRRWRRGEIPGFRLASNVLRFRESEVEVWLEGQRAGARSKNGLGYDLREVSGRATRERPRP
jgi:excisionase family DNA binding protein